MKIRQYKIFKFSTQFNIYGSLGHSYYQNPISHVENFLNDAYGYVYRQGGAIQFLNSLCIQKNAYYGITINTIELNIDKHNNIIFLGEIFDFDDLNMPEEEFNNKFKNMTSLQLCQNKIIDGALMSKTNFIYLLNTWGKIIDTTPVFILLYQDDQGWYDVLPFQTQKAMNQFIADHTKQLNKD